MVEGKDKAEGAKGLLSAYKPREGYATRLGGMVVLASFVAFACYRWYYGWPAIHDLLGRFFRPLGLGILVDWVDVSPWYGKAIGFGGAVIIGAVGFLLSYYYIYARPSTADFLIKTDGELRKVTWPKYEPWFKPDTEVWGATYVVLLVVLGLTLYIYGVDWVFQALARVVFYD
jgi:preprotein translocase SecE subunit